MTSCQHGPQMLTPRCESCQLADMKAENARLRAALEDIAMAYMLDKSGDERRIWMEHRARLALAELTAGP